MGNPFVHVELETSDLAKAQGFYTKLFDWQLEDMKMGDGSAYSLIKVGDGTGGGMMKSPLPGNQSMWLAYVLVDDVRKATEKARSLGASICKDVTEIPGIGSFSIFNDPTGAMLALWQPAAKK